MTGLTSNSTRTRRRRRPSLVVLRSLFLIALFAIPAKGAEVFQNSYISPNSAGNNIKYESIEEHRTSAPLTLEEPSSHLVSSSSKIVNENENLKKRVERSADPILSEKTIGAEDLFAFKNVLENLDSNDVEYSGRVIIQPSRTIKDERPIHLDSTEADAIFGRSGEGRGAPQIQGRSMSLSLLEPQIQPSATIPQNFATQSLHQNLSQNGRQANPDIQDIITGIVKLLNGNVNVQANTQLPLQGRPLRPLSTRINNRGPPRISDVPALPPDFDVPKKPYPPHPLDQMTPPVAVPLGTRIPTPYPFDVPPQNTSPINGRPHPDQIIPLGSNKVPGFYRPVTLPPWQRPPPRGPPPHRRPIPPYKPKPFPRPQPPAEDTISITSERPEHEEHQEQQDILNLDLGQTLPSHFQNQKEPKPEPELQEEIQPSHLPPHLSSSHPSTEDDDEGTEETEEEEEEDVTSEESINEELQTEQQQHQNQEVDDKDQSHQHKHEHEHQSNDEEMNEEDVKFEKNKEKSTSKMDKHSSSFSSMGGIASTSTHQQESGEYSVFNVTQSLKKENVLVSTIPSSLSSSEILNQSSVNVDNVQQQQSSSPNIEATPVLESSIQDVLETLKDNLLNPNLISSTSTPTEGLKISSASSSSPSILSSTSNLLNSTSSASDSLNQASSSSNQSGGFQFYPYKPRPGIVLDDTLEYKPDLGLGLGQHQHQRPIITARPLHSQQIGDIFDITVSVVQGQNGGGSGATVTAGFGGTSSGGQGKPYIIPVDIENINSQNSNVDVITSPIGDEGFVSIDGKRTYLNLFGEATETPHQNQNQHQHHQMQPTKVGPLAASTNAITGTGFAVVEQEKTNKPLISGGGNGKIPGGRRPPIYNQNRRPSHTTVRIDTCIVGDDSTCDGSQNEICRTELGVSACHCRPGHARRKHREPCRKVVSVLVSLRVDRLYERRVVWANELADKTSESYQHLSYETERALESAMSMTPFTDVFLNAKVNSIYKGERSAGQAGVFVNLTLQLEENGETSRPSIRGDLQRHLLGVIQRRSNNVGNSALWVDSPPGSVSNLQDLDECSSPELHDCHSLATCTNTFGGFKCECLEGYRDPWLDNKHRQGRYCEQCSPQRCNNRGECKYKNGQEVCVCVGNYYGNQCELDGEVLGVAIGASVAAIIIIGLTLVCLVMWSRKWSREQKAAAGSPVFSYMAAAGNTVKTPVVGGPPYQLTLEDRVRWAHIADVMAQSNHYAPEPVTGPTRPSSAMFGYPTLSMAGTLPHRSMHGTLPPVPMPRLTLQSQFGSRAASVHGMRPLDNSSSSDEEDKADLLGRNFQVPRPKSRSNASIANQSGIYYDVDYDQHDAYKHHQGPQGPGGIPLSTYAVGRPQYFRN